MAATATAIPAAAIRPIDNAPEVATALAALQPVAEKAALLAERKRRYEEILDPYIDTTSAVSEDLMLEATEALPTVRVECARATREMRQAEAALTAARAVERERLRAVFHTQMKAIIVRLNASLKAAARDNRALIALENRQREVTGDWSRSPLSWFELADESPIQGSRLTDWRRACIEAQLLDRP